MSTFKYERLPIFCHYCGVLGHDLKHCAVHYAVEKKGGRIEYQYGDFLRAMGGRPRALGSKEAGQNYVNEDSKGCEVEKSFCSGGAGWSVGEDGGARAQSWKR